MVQRQQVECLHHVGAVGTGQRHVGLQVQGAVQGADAVLQGLVGQVLALAVGIEHGQQQRAELVSVRDATEADTGFPAFFQEAEFQAWLTGGFGLARQLVRAQCHVGQEIEHFLCLRMGGIVNNMECVAGFQLLENAAHLGQYACL